MVKYVFITFVTSFTLTTLAYGDVDFNGGALHAYYSNDKEEIATYDLVQKPELSIFIRNMNGELIKINLSKETFLYEIKDLIEEIWGAPYEKQKFVYSGRQLEERYNINHYLNQNLQDGSIITLVVMRT